jgi:hypothetical protein
VEALWLFCSDLQGISSVPISIDHSWNNGMGRLQNLIEILAIQLAVVYDGSPEALLFSETLETH